MDLIKIFKEGKFSSAQARTNEVNALRKSLLKIICEN